MKQVWPAVIILFFVVLFVYTKLAGPIPFSVNSVNTTKTDMFTSQGQGEVTAVPDTATIDAGVTQTAVNVSDAKSKTDEAIKKILGDVKNLGISDSDIKTTNYSVTPNYSNEIMPMIAGRTQNITGYTVTQSLEIKIKQLDKANKVIDTVTSDGANLVGGINFTFSDDLQKKLENKARQIAVNEAKTKAQDLAQAAGIRLGKIINVVESSNSPRFVPLMAGGGTADKSQPSANVTPGENKVSITVTLYYETY